MKTTMGEDFFLAHLLCLFSYLNYLRNYFTKTFLPSIMYIPFVGTSTFLPVKS